jgi:sugar transferase (PEP-CTERM/EpsH1 system associated)
MSESITTKLPTESDDVARIAASDERLRVLVMSPFFPYPPVFGFLVRTFNLTRMLARRHDVTVLTYIRSDQQRHVPEAGQELNLEVVNHDPRVGLAKRVSQLGTLFSARPFDVYVVASKQMQSAIDRICAQETFDLIQVESCTMAQFRFPEGIPIVVDEHNIESELRRRLMTGERSAIRRLYSRLELRRFCAFEHDVWRRADGCVLTSEREVDQVARAAPQVRISVVPNGVDLERFAPSDAPVDANVVVFNGTFDYRPNVDGAEFLVDQVWPRVLDRRPGLRLQLVGRMPESARGRLTRAGVEILGEVDHVQPYLERAAVVAVPIRMGGGTRLKVVEALAMGKAIVSTSIGCEGIAVRNDVHLTISDDPDEFATRILELLEDPTRREQLGLAGRALIEARYSWDAACEGLDALYRDVLASRRRARA